MDRGAWQATVHEVAKSRTRLSDFTSSLCEQSQRQKHVYPEDALLQKGSLLTLVILLHILMDSLNPQCSCNLERDV